LITRALTNPASYAHGQQRYEERQAERKKRIAELDKKLERLARDQEEAERAAEEAYLDYLRALGRAQQGLGRVEFASECLEDTLIAGMIILAIEAIYLAAAAEAASSQGTGSASATSDLEGSERPPEPDGDGGGEGCFVAGTVVHTANGEDRIENIEVGDAVWSHDASRGEWALRDVLATMRHRFVGSVVEVTLVDSHFVTTGNHPIWVCRGERLAHRRHPTDLPQRDASMTSRGRWVAAEDLRVGDVLLTRQGERRVSVIRYRQLDGYVYNIQVLEHETYAVGSRGVLVHNKPRPRGAGPGDTKRVDELANKHNVPDSKREAVHDAIRDEKRATDGGEIDDETLERIVKEFGEPK